MNQEFGNVELFCDSFARNPESPSVEAYLQTVGLSQSEADDVLAQFEQFSVAIRNADSSDLPDIPNRDQATSPAKPYSVN